MELRRPHSIRNAAPGVSRTQPEALAAAAALLDRLVPPAQGKPQTGQPAAGPAWFWACLSSGDGRELLSRLAGEIPGLSGKSAARFLDALAARIESRLRTQINAILHHNRFQALEAAWRGLDYLRRQTQAQLERAAEDRQRVQIWMRLLNVTKEELLADSKDAIQFDQTALWKAVYEHEFGVAGGRPFGLLVGDYQFRHGADDLQTLRSLAEVAAAAFAPLVAAAAPQMFGMDDFQRLSATPEVGDKAQLSAQRVSLEKYFQGPDFIKWQAFRREENSRFIGLTLPRVLMRRPYRLDPTRGDGLRFSEAVDEEASHERYLWGSAAYAFAAVVVRAFGESGWFADLRGFERGVETGGLVCGLTVDCFGTDRDGLALKTSTDIAIGGGLERELSELGFIPLCPCYGTEYSVFYSNASIQQPKTYSDAAATTTARMSAMLQYLLCASRFAHFLKSICREKLGSFQDADAIETELSGWIHKFVTNDPKANPEAKALHPLREAEVAVEEIPGTAGGYQLKMNLLPHYQLDALSASLRLVHRLTARGE